MSAIINKINYCVFIGDDFKATLEIKDNDGVVIDVSSYSFKMQIRKNRSDATIIKELVSPTDIDITNGANGIIVLNIDTTDTIDFEEQTAVYDIFWIDDTGERRTISQGTFQILERVTKN